jgi:hypothetical protein
MNRALTRLFALMAAAALAALAGCQLPPEPEQSRADAELLVNTSLADIGAEATSVTITGIGPGSTTFSRTASGQPTRIEGLKTGAWTVTAEAWSATGELLAVGTAPATLRNGRSAAVVIVTQPVLGRGALNASVSWPAGTLTSPAVQGRLVPVYGAAHDLVFATNGSNSLDFNAGAVPGGLYTVAVTLTDGGVAVASAAAVLRVVADQAVSVTFQLSTGGARPELGLTVTPALESPLGVALTGQVATLYGGAEMTVTASGPEGGGSLVTQWFLDGAFVGRATAVTVGGGLAEGAHRLDAAAFSWNGAGFGAATHAFNVVASPTASATLEWDRNEDTSTVGYRLHYGLASGAYTTTVQVGNVVTHTLTGLTPGLTYYIAATAYDAAGMDSGYSNEVVFPVP